MVQRILPISCKNASNSMPLRVVSNIVRCSRPNRNSSKPVMYALVIHACLAVKAGNRPSAREFRDVPLCQMMTAHQLNKLRRLRFLPEETDLPFLPSIDFTLVRKPSSFVRCSGFASQNHSVNPSGLCMHDARLSTNALGNDLDENYSDLSILAQEASGESSLTASHPESDVYLLKARLIWRQHSMLRAMPDLCWPGLMKVTLPSNCWPVF